MSNLFGDQTYDRVFYSINQDNERVDSNNPRKVGPGEIYEYLQDVAANPGNFIGFVDSQGVTLQFYVDEIDNIWVEVPSPDHQGSFGKHITNEELSGIVDTLSEPYEKYIESLNLELRKW